MHEFAIDSNKPSASFTVIPPSEENNCESKTSDKSLDELIRKKIDDRKRFFGIEISPASSGEALDYNKFAVQPLFTSVTWLFDYNLKFDSFSEAPAVRLGKQVEKCSPVLMHLTCYKLDREKLREFLDVGFKNILAVKGGE